MLIQDKVDKLNSTIQTLRDQLLVMQVENTDLKADIRQANVTMDRNIDLSQKLIKETAKAKGEIRNVLREIVFAVNPLAAARMASELLKRLK